MDFTYRFFPPPPGLCRLMSGTFYACGRITYRYDKILPTGLVAALFNLGAPHRLGKSTAVGRNRRFAAGWLHGIQTTPVYNLPGDGTHVLGLLFEPVGFHSLFGIDMRGLADRTVDVRSVLPPAFVTAVKAICPKAGIEAGHGAIHETIAAWPRREPPEWLWRFAEKLRARRGMLGLADAYREIGLSPRYINDRFKRAVGVSPKVLARIYRLNALLTAIDPAAPVSWTELAHRFGFYDQAHFNREFRRFSGLAPSAYLDRRRRDLPSLGPGDSGAFAPQR